MNKPLQRELFAQRPVRSDFARRRTTTGFNPRKVVLIVLIAGVAVVGGIVLNSLGGGASEQIEETPTIQAAASIKQRPDQPGGIDIPHQDVQVFEKLDNKTEAPKASGVEHLLPPPDEPKAPSPAHQQAMPAPAADVAPAPQVVPTPAPVEPVAASAPPSDQAKAEENLLKAPEELPPAITSAAEDVNPKEAVIAAEKPVEPVKAEVKSKVAPAKEAVKAVEKPVAAVKTETVKVIEKTPAIVKKKTDTAESVKAETAMARLPKELFTSDDYTPSASPVEQAAAQPKVSEKVVAPSVSGKSASVQVASFNSEAQAQQELSRFSQKYADVLGGASLRIVKADLGAKGIYYRLISSSMAEEKAKSVCAQISNAKKGSCLVVK